MADQRRDTPKLEKPILTDALRRHQTFDIFNPSQIVQIDRVSKTFATASGSVKALDDVSLALKANEFFTLLGPSGCGKTTLLRLVAGFDHPDAGAIFLGGRAVVNDPPNKRPINIVFQSYALFPHLSVRQNVAFGLERQRLPAKLVGMRVDAMLRLVQLDDVGNRKPAQLSGGQQQRVALARALAPNPKLLLLDEPLSALDRKLRRGMQIELKRLQRETGITFVLVTHDQEEALSMSDRIAVMNAGRIQQIGAPREVYEHPRTRFVAEFMGANVVRGDMAGARDTWVAIRPEDVEMTTEGDGHRACVREAIYHGAATSYLVALDAGPLVKVETAGQAMLGCGDRVVCRFPAAALAPLEE